MAYTLRLREVYLEVDSREEALAFAEAWMLDSEAVAKQVGSKAKPLPKVEPSVAPPPEPPPEPTVVTFRMVKPEVKVTPQAPASVWPPLVRDGTVLKQYRLRAAAYLKSACKPCRKTHVAVACQIPDGSLTPVFDHPLFFVLPSGEIRLVEATDDKNINIFRQLVAKRLGQAGRRKECELVQDLQIPEVLSNTVFKDQAFKRRMDDGTIYFAGTEETKAEPESAEFVQVIRKRLARLLPAYEGPKSVDFIANMLGHSVDEISHAANHEWFEISPEGISMAKDADPKSNAEN